MSERIEWIEHWVHEVVKMSRLPVPNEIRGPTCMIGPRVWMLRRIRRLFPWLVPLRDPQDCCFHHRVNWRQAAGAAVRLVRQAQAVGLSGERLDDYVMERVRDEDLGGREQTAIVLLVGSGAGIQLHDPDAPWRYFDGQHRVAAQFDQGVRRTIVQRLELLDPTTGRPVPD